MHLSTSLLLASIGTAVALCPMAELTRRGLAPEELAETYRRGEGLGETIKKRQENSPPILNPVASVLGSLTPREAEAQSNPPPVLDPLSGVLSGIGLGALVPRSPRSAEHNAIIEDHLRSRLEERDEDVNIDAPILTPKAHKRHVAERGLLGGFLGPLSGILAGLDVPTPQPSGLKEIPGNDAAHQYQAPKKTDIRGTCPTLNTLANHGYLNRDGVTSFAQATNAIQTAYSMSFDIAVFLSALGLLAGGDIPTGIYSIGGTSSKVPQTLGVPLYGIDRHGLFEIDASISRGDRYFGDNHSFNITRWNQVVGYANKYGKGLFNIAAMENMAADDVENSRATNPEFAMGANFAVIYATRALLTRPLPNGTNPDFPNFSNIAPFYLNETFPDNWFRIPDSYSLVDLGLDIGNMFLFKPQPLGANVNGKFVPLDVTIPDAPADVGCLALTFLAAGAPNELEPAVQAAGNAVLSQLLAPALGNAGCNIKDYDVPANVSYKVSGEDINGGSGSGITHLGEWDSKTAKPSGLSKGDPVRRRVRST